MPSHKTINPWNRNTFPYSTFIVSVKRGASQQRPQHATTSELHQSHLTAPSVPPPSRHRLTITFVPPPPRHRLTITVPPPPLHRLTIPTLSYGHQDK
ncbi:hypothetical protein E2C01_098448 [Portunus trituberculatus]|uniref:Uncharacterized protein n=1 Tax=Portunus trituberculatus TaxID=210409 RepID=A0A5B7JXV0_PORTR|nr:hypothetical protein [Portunus trituberculatus]